MEATALTGSQYSIGTIALIYRSSSFRGSHCQDGASGTLSLLTPSVSWQSCHSRGLHLLIQAKFRLGSRRHTPQRATKLNAVRNVLKKRLGNQLELTIVASVDSAFSK
jgi:hypothetical protein